MSETKIKNEVINSGISMKEFEVLDFGKDGKVHWTNTKKGRMFRNLIKK